MHRPRNYAVLLLVLAVLSCDKQQGTTPQGPAGNVQRETLAVLAPSAQLDDRPFEDLIAKLDLAKSLGARGANIVDQIRKTRAAVEKQTTSSISGGPRLASVASTVGNFSFAQFSSDFAYVLDVLTEKGGTQPYPERHFSATESGPNTTTTTTLAVTEVFSGSGSVVTGRLQWTYSTITIDTSPNAGGATLIHLQDDRGFEGSIDVCPSGTGAVPASLSVTAKIVAEKGGETTRRTSSGSSTFTGSVNDQAGLTSVAQVSRNETSSETTSGQPTGNKSNIAATWNAAGGSLLGNLADGTFNADLEATGASTLGDAAKAAGWDTALGIYAVEATFFSAQNLWQKGRCVVVAVPQWSAETSIKIQEQQKVQHTEEVDLSSDTKFTVQLKHRFQGGSLSKPTEAKLTDGKEKITPDKLEQGGGQVTYRAGDEDDKEATAQLKSTSNRGIGTLVLKFKTVGKEIMLSVRGTQTLGSFVKLRTTISIGPTKFTNKDDHWEGTGPFSGTSVLVPPDKDCPGLTITQSGTMAFTAKLEKRGEQNFFVISYGAGGNSRAVGTGCDADVTEALAVGGGFGAGLFMGNVGDLVFPSDGGTISLSGSQGTGSASGSATLTVTKKK